jgi:hypothetical protein
MSSIKHVPLAVALCIGCTQYTPDGSNPRSQRQDPYAEQPSARGAKPSTGASAAEDEPDRQESQKEPDIYKLDTDPLIRKVRELQQSPEKVDLPELKALHRDDHYRCVPYLKAAMAVQALGRSRGLIALAKLTAGADADDQPAIILCRMLFAKKTGSKFRRPLVGAAGFLGKTDYADWPLEPIELVDGVPFLITRGYKLAGLSESAERYLAYCIANCDWNAFRYQPKTDLEKAAALAKLLGSGKWKRPLYDFEKEFLSDQIK